MTLTATPASGSTFGGWTGDADCTDGSVTMSAARSCTATFSLAGPSSYNLTVSVVGTGSGTVTSSPAGIDCGSDCSESYTSGTAVTLTATPAGGSTFAGWSGDADCGDGSVTMSATRTCTATFSTAGSGPAGLAPVGAGVQIVNDAAVVADVDAAFDAVQQQYLVVWHTWNAEVKGLLLNSQGQAIGSAFLIDSGAVAPRAAYSVTSQAYLVTYTKGKARLARTVTPAGGGGATLGTVWSLGEISWVAGHGNPGGAAWLPASNTFLATWWDGASGIMVRTVGAAGPTGTAAAMTATDTQEMPEIACGPTVCLVVGRTWDQVIWGRWVIPSGLTYGARFTIEQGSSARDMARVAYSATTGTFTVAWTRSGIPQTTTLAAGATTPGAIQPVVAGRVGTQLDLAFNIGLNAFGLAAQGNASDIWAQGLDSVGTPLTGAVATVSEIATTDGRPVIVANATTSQFLVVYRPTLQTLRARLVGGSTSSTYALTVSTAGTGSGTVTSNPAGINCGSDCSEDYASGTAVTLTATAASGSSFAGWTGDADCSDGSVTMSEARSCTATFNLAGPTSYALTAATAGSGTVTSTPAGINCGSDCSESYTSGTVVTLVATPASGWTFAGWTGDADCSDGSVTMSAARSCTATFSTNFVLNIALVGTGFGTVTSNPAGISCGGDCSESYASGTVVTLTATPAGGSTFAGWSGDADCSDGSVTMSGARACAATFSVAGGGPTALTPIGTGTQIVNDPGVVADLDAAFDSAQQQYLVVWHTWNADVKGLFLNAQGQALGGAFLIDTNAVAPRAAYSATNQAYLVTYTKGQARLARTVTPAGGSATLGTVWSLGAMSWVAGHGNPGGTAWVPSSNTFLTTWWDGASTILVRAVGASGPTGTATTLTASDVQEMPEIACGPTACLVVGRTWDQLIWGRWLNLSGTATSARFTIEQGASTARDWVRVAYSETAGAFTVAWTRGGIPQTTTLAPGATSAGTIQPVVAGRVGTQLDLAFNSALNVFGVAAQGNASDVWAQGLDSAGTPLAGAVAAVSEAATTDGRPVIVANPATAQFLVIYRPTLQTLRTRLVGGNAPSTVVLTVSTTGTGVGTVTSSPAGINCGSDCSESYASGAVVTLTATPAGGSMFMGWASGDADCSDGVVTMGAAHNCIAIFNLSPTVTYALNVATAGTGSGTVTSSPPGIDCGSDCSEAYASGTVVTLTATPASGSTFSGWTGDADCSDGAVTMSAARGCTATFSTSGGGSTGLTPVGTGVQIVNDAAVVADFDAAFDAVQQQYLVVWHTWNADIKGVFLNAQGQALGSAFLIDTNALAPRAAYSPVSQTYLVTYTKGSSRLARTVTPTGGGATLGTVWALGAMSWVAGHGNPGGTAWVPSSNTFLTTWWDGASTILVRAVGAGGPTGPATTLAGTDAQELPEITCGPTACLVVGRTWDQLIWGRWLNLSGSRDERTLHD